MFELTVEAVFSAAHAILISGTREPVHGHDWHVTACVTGESVDEQGLLIDFHALEERLAGVIGPFRNADLNRTPPFDRVNPTAENVARHIGTALAERLGDGARGARGGVRVAWVRVTEAPGCAVTYRL